MEAKAGETAGNSACRATPGRRGGDASTHGLRGDGLAGEAAIFYGRAR